jgi:DNA-binding NarL/FixJ family response regulator
VDVAVIDSSMPGGGPDLVRRLRATSASLRVVVLSASDSPAARAAAADAGAAGYLVKGEPLGDIVAAVRGSGP